jgi:hypothetical protein
LRSQGTCEFQAERQGKQAGWAAEVKLLKLLSIWARLSRNDRVRFVIVTVAYALTMRVTQSIPFKGSGLSPVWFPTGVALFFLLWWSPKLWPAVFIA